MNKARILGLAVLLLGLPSSAWSETIGFSISDANRNLYRINLETGASVSLGVIPYATDDDLEGLTSDGSRILAVSEANFGNGSLWDVSTPPGALIGATGNRFGTESGAAFNAANSVLYNINANDDPNAGPIGSQLYSISTATGLATAVGTGSGFYADGLAINAAGLAFASDFRLSDSLYSVNLSTGALTLIGGFGIGNTDLDSGLEFADDGTLWALTEDGAIYTVNTSTGAATFRAFATLSDGTRVQGDLEGLAIPGNNVIPEPSTMVLLGVGLIGLCGALGRARRSA